MWTTSPNFRLCQLIRLQIRLLIRSRCRSRRWSLQSTARFSERLAGPRHLTRTIQSVTTSSCWASLWVSCCSSLSCSASAGSDLFQSPLTRWNVIKPFSPCFVLAMVSIDIISSYLSQIVCSTNFNILPALAQAHLRIVHVDNRPQTKPVLKAFKVGAWGVSFGVCRCIFCKAYVKGRTGNIRSVV